jgi:gliding motility-associatede transport system auxiliary component
MAADIESTPTNRAPSTGSGMSTGKRFAIGINVIFQVLILALIFALINFVGFRRFVRWDFSRDQKFALSSQTKSLLGSLPKPVKAIIYFSGAGVGGQIAPDVEALLKEYDYASGRNLTVETVNPYRNLSRARELADKYKFAQEENIVILDYDGKSKFVNANDMVNMEQAQMNPFQPTPPQITAFKGEAAITAALLELVEGKPQKLYVTSGHGEPEVKTGAQPDKPDDVTILGEYFKRSNIKYESLKLLDVERVPEDATVLMIFGPRMDFSEREIELIDNYWKSNGRLVIILNGASKTPNLNNWLATLGVKPGTGRLIRTVTVLNITNGQRDNRVQGSAEGTFTTEGREITKDLADQNAFFFGPSTYLELDKAKAATENIRFIELAKVGKEFWAELDPMVTGIPARDPAREKEGPFTVAVALEKGAMPGLKVDTSRAVVIANSGFLTDGGLSQFEYGLDFGLNAVNYALNREKGPGVGIPPKEKKLTALTLDEAKLSKLGYAVVLGLPAIVAFFGVITWFQRRH